MCMAQKSVRGVTQEQRAPRELLSARTLYLESVFYGGLFKTTPAYVAATASKEKIVDLTLFIFYDVCIPK